MPTKIAIAFSQADNPQEAAQQACISIKNQLNAAQTDLIIVFACSAYASKLTLETIHSILKPQRLIGSSVTGIILSEGVYSNGLGILAINSTEMGFGITCCPPDDKTDLRSKGYEWGRHITSNCNLAHHQACLLFGDYTQFNNASFLLGVQDVLGFGCPLAGAISSNNLKTNDVFQFFQKEILTKNTVGVLFGGTTAAATGIKHGFKPLGKPRTITRAHNNVIQLIDDQPALHIYEEYLGPEAESLIKGGFNGHSVIYPLGIYMEEFQQYLLKNAVDILVDGSIVCQGDVPEGAEVHLMIGNRDSCKQSAAEAAMQVKNSLGGRQAKLIIIIESVARHKILRNNSNVELQAIKDVLGYTTAIIGMYGFGEIVPLLPGQSTHNASIQNESILILAIE